jgi:hypothetical protein
LFPEPAFSYDSVDFSTVILDQFNELFCLKKQIEKLTKEKRLSTTFANYFLETLRRLHVFLRNSSWECIGQGGLVNLVIIYWGAVD